MRKIATLLLVQALCFVPLNNAFSKTTSSVKKAKAIVPTSASAQSTKNVDESAVPTSEKTQTLVIFEPADRATVGWQPIVRGTVSGSRNIWLVVRTVETSEYWVQPKPKIAKNGQWGVRVYIGNATATANNRDFEIMAIANPTEDIVEGQVFDTWPTGKFISNIVRVVRNKQN